MDTAKLFQNGQSQAVRLPKEYRFEGNEVVIKKIGNAVVLLPLDNPWQVMEEGLKQFSDDFMSDRHQPKEQQHRDDPFE
ncbi:MAG TPA: type II toxin-antitoxin system VapB family antitoxin [Acidiferrobacterales bacterium]|nr:type II toxin-antitoxin system VapB family antitoxin [Acidiferrobacterales bacterium]